MVKYLFAAATVIGLGSSAMAGGTGSPQILSDAEMNAIVAGHAPGIGRDIFPTGLEGNGDGTPAHNGHEGVQHAQSMGGRGNHPDTETEFAGPNHPLKP